MADDYVQRFQDADRLPVTASATIASGGLCVEVTGAYTAAPTTGVSAKFLGVALFPVASGAAVTVSTSGVHTLTSSAAINAGDRVTTAASGQIATFTGTTYSQIIGTALTTVAGSGLPVDVLIGA